MYDSLSAVGLSTFPQLTIENGECKTSRAIMIITKQKGRKTLMFITFRGLGMEEKQSG